MPKYTTGYTLGITRQQMLAIQLMADGVPKKDIVRVVFDVRGEDGEEDPAKVERGKKTLYKWLHDQKVIDAYREILREFIMATFPRALKRIAAQVDDSNGWLSNKASNDILSRFSDEALGTNSNEVVIRVENGPTLGTPDSDD